MQIHFDSPKNFAEFITRHGARPDRGEDKRPEIFVERALSGESRNSSPFEERISFERYTAIVIVNNVLMRAFMASMPSLPNWWRLLQDKRAGVFFTSKQEMLTYLKRIGASPDKVKNLTKMKAQELKEFLDSSDENTTEITERHEVKTSEPVTFGVSGLKLIDNVTCDLKHGPHGYGNSTSFAITADVSKQWDEKEREIAEAIGKDFIIYRGHIDEGSRGY